MTDAPETIWVNIDDSEDGCRPVEDDKFGDGRFYDHNTSTEYRRADLPPTLSAAMQVPEVRALVCIAERAEFYIDLIDSDDRFSTDMRAAIAPFKEAKP